MNVVFLIVFLNLLITFDSSIMHLAARRINVNLDIQKIFSFSIGITDNESISDQNNLY